MQKRESLKEVERRAYRSTFEDGFYEMVWGGLFLLFAWFPVLESGGVSRFYCYPSILLLALIPWLGKRYVTIPRLGEVEFGEKRKARKRYITWIGVGALVLMLPVVTVMLATDLPRGQTWLTFALIIAPVVAIGVLLMGYSRMYIYALLFLSCIVTSEILLEYIGSPLGNLLAFGLPGIAIAGYGFLLLQKFLKDYPKLTAEATDVS